MGLFDTLMVNIFHNEEKINEEYNEKIITKKLNLGRNKDKLYILLPPWGNLIKQNYFIRKQLLKNDYSFLELQFPRKILSNDWEKTLKYFKKIELEIKKEIKEIQKKHNFKEINLIGISIGCVNACMIANNNKNINNLYLIVPGNCLATCMWTGIATQKLKQEYQKQNISLEQLQNYWKDLAPENNLNFLGNKIYVQISKVDKIINFNQGEKLIEKIKEKQISNEIKISENKNIIKSWATPQAKA